jgi:hypothetical protein
MPGHYAESIHGRPDRALRVECTFNRRTKAIRFESCGNCSFTKLRKKVRTPAADGCLAGADGDIGGAGIP